MYVHFYCIFYKLFSFTFCSPFWGLFNSHNPPRCTMVLEILAILSAQLQFLRNWKQPTLYTILSSCIISISVIWNVNGTRSPTVVFHLPHKNCYWMFALLEATERKQRAVLTLWTLFTYWGKTNIYKFPLTRKCRYLRYN